MIQNRNKIVTILVIGPGNRDFDKKVVEICAMLREDPKHRGARLTVRFCPKIAMAPQHIRALPSIDIVYFRSSGGKVAYELIEEACAIADAMKEQKNEPWIILGKDDGSQDPDPTRPLVRLSYIFAGLGVCICFGWTFGTIYRRLETENTRPGPSGIRAA